jgi:hypothetical protein
VRKPKSNRGLLANRGVTGVFVSRRPDDIRLLGGSDATPNPFEIKENRRREDIHHRMVDRVARSKRAEKSLRETKTSKGFGVASLPPSRRISSGDIAELSLSFDEVRGYSGSSSSTKAYPLTRGVSPPVYTCDISG